MSKITDELLDELMKDKSPEELVGKDGLVNQLKAKIHLHHPPDTSAMFFSAGEGTVDGPSCAV